jgi:hypothetical protein
MIQNRCIIINEKRIPTCVSPFGRLWPSIIAHATYDSLQVIQIVMVCKSI